jgi:hypothetical protein
MRAPLASLVMLFATLCAPTFVALANETFLSGIEDVPLAPGMVELPGGLLFDSPAGRIVDTRAETDLTTSCVREVYSQTLQQLGWQAMGEMHFRRDNEILKIEFEEKKRPLMVHFTLTPTH